MILLSGYSKSGKQFGGRNQREADDKEGEMDILNQATLILMLVAYIAGILTAMMMLAPRIYRG